MPRFYFTYGSDMNYPFQNGWTEVVAPNIQVAINAFRAYHPDKHEATVNCCDYYTEVEMLGNGMLKDGNGEAFCHEFIGNIESPLKLLDSEYESYSREIKSRGVSWLAKRHKFDRFSACAVLFARAGVISAAVRNGQLEKARQLIEAYMKGEV